jgi:hypothetical protein
VVGGAGEPTVLGQIQVVRFTNPSGLAHQGGNMYAPTAASGQPAEGTPGAEGFGQIAQGVLEMSNVQVVEEMVNMITAQRAYEVNSKSIQTADDMLQTAEQPARDDPRGRCRSCDPSGFARRPRLLLRRRPRWRCFWRRRPRLPPPRPPPRAFRGPSPPPSRWPRRPR